MLIGPNARSDGPQRLQTPVGGEVVILPVDARDAADRQQAGLAVQEPDRVVDQPRTVEVASLVAEQGARPTAADDQVGDLEAARRARPLWGQTNVQHPAGPIVARSTDLHADEVPDPAVLLTLLGSRLGAEQTLTVDGQGDRRAY